MPWLERPVEGHPPLLPRGRIRAAQEQCLQSRQGRIVRTASADVRRLNVATSRARCVATIVASPVLLTPGLPHPGTDAPGQSLLPLPGAGGGRPARDGPPGCRQSPTQGPARQPMRTQLHVVYRSAYAIN